MSQIVSKRSYRNSSSFKMAVLFTSLLGGAALLLFYALFDLNQRSFVRETAAAIDSELDYLLFAMADVSPDARVNWLHDWAEQRNGLLLGLRDRAGVLVAGNLVDLPALGEVAPITEGLVSFYTRLNGEHRRVVAKIHTFDSGQQLLVGRDVSQIDNSRIKVNVLSAVILFFMLLVVLSSFFISTFVVRRINSIAAITHEIMETGDLSRRIHFKTTWDDLGDLAQTLNLFLARIQGLMNAVREVTDNIAHDMRTPLTRLRNHLEQTLERAESGQLAGPESLSELLEESDKLLSVFKALLRLAALEKGKRHQAFVEVDFNALLIDVVEFYAPLAEDKSIELNLGPVSPYTRQGDRDLLFQVFANVLDNAIKFTPPGGRIMVSLQATHPGAQICIADSGAGIAPEDVDKVFDRFYRAEQSRHTPGSGLGLSLVLIGVQLHGGRVVLAPNNPGLKCLIFL